MPDLVPDKLLKLASPEELEYYLKLLHAQKAMESPLDYAMYTTPGAQRFRHTEYLNSVLVALVNKRLYKSGIGPQAVLKYRNKRDKKGQWVHPVTGEKALHRLKISLPPQVGKSFIVGEHFTAWYMRTHPNENIMYITYASPLAEKISRKAMTTIDRTPELGNTLDPERRSIKNWAIEGGLGEFIARGVSGSVTGFGGNVIFDDPHADGPAALSPIERNAVLELWDSSVATRTGGGFKWAIVVQTRWHPNDLSGHLEETDGDNWFPVVLPALAYDTVNEEGISIHPELSIPDPLGRHPGESVCPELYSEADFADHKRRNPFWWDAEYQGLPTSSEGSLFSMFNTYRLIDGVYEIERPDGAIDYFNEQDCYRYGIMDMAISEKSNADYTVYGVFDLTPKRDLLVRAIIRRRIPSTEHLSFMYTQAEEYNVNWTGIEDVTFGSVLIQTAVKENRITIRRLKTKNKDKFTRAVTVAEMNGNGKVYIPQKAEWVDDYRLEMRQFRPGADHDDQVDVTSYAGIEAQKIPLTFSKAPIRPTNDYGVARRPKIKRIQISHDDIGSGW
jgi:predicted phage terminase large subunit-like protein